MAVSFFLAESDDRVDPDYQFSEDSYSASRLSALDHDVYAHQLYRRPNADGYLVTRSGLASNRVAGVLNAGGIHDFLRLKSSIPIIADCGAFQYRDAENPPYTCEETCEFYESLGFDYGISLDHMIFEFDPEYDDGTSLLTKSPTPEMERRFRLSIENAKAMRRICEEKQYQFHLIGGVQGWSPQSYHQAVRELIKDGFDYIALGGLARANDEQLRAVLDAVRETVVSNNTKLLVFGVARLSLLEDYARTNVASCDSASTILQAFKSNKDNYHTRERNYTAVRIPPASGDLSPKVSRLLKKEAAKNGEAISDYGAHNQRGILTIEIKTQDDSIVWIEELVEMAEQSASSPVYPLLKREDERHVTMEAFDNPAFVEDITRNAVVKLRADERVKSFRVGVVNHESIHNHSAFSLTVSE